MAPYQPLSTINSFYNPTSIAAPKPAPSAPSWQSTLSTVQNSPSWNTPAPKPTSPTAPNFQPLSGPATYVPPPSLGNQAKFPSSQADTNTLSQSQIKTPPPPPPQVFTTPSGVQVDASGKVVGGTSSIGNGTQSSTQNNPNLSVPANTGLYGQLIGAGANTSLNAANTGANNYSAANTYLQNLAQNGSQGVQTATSNLQNLQNQMAGQVAGIESQPIPLEFQQGREGVLGRLYSSQLSNAQTALQNALTGQGQQIQAGSALLGGGLSSQGQGIGGLGQNTAFAQPQNQFGILTNPLTGEPINQNPGGLGSVAYTGGQIQGQMQAGANSVPIAQAISKAQPIAQNLDTLIQTNHINTADTTWGNALNNYIRTNVSSDSAITEFGGQINDLAQTLAPALGVPGGATTDFKTALGQSIVNGLQKGASVSQSIQYFIQQAQQGAQGAQQGALNPNATINGTNNTNNSIFNF